MGNLLRLVQNLHSQVIDENKLKYFTSKISMWNHISMLQTSYQSLNVEEKTALLKRYYTNLNAKYYGKEPGKFYSLPSEDCLIFYWLMITVFACCILVIFRFYILLQF